MSGCAGPPSRQMPTLAPVAPTPMSGAMQPPSSTWPLARSPMQIFRRCRWCQQCTRGARLMCLPACPPACGKCCSSASVLTLLHGPLLQICTRLTPVLLTQSLAHSAASLPHAYTCCGASLPWYMTMCPCIAYSMMLQPLTTLCTQTPDSKSLRPLPYTLPQHCYLPCRCSKNS